MPTCRKVKCTTARAEIASLKRELKREQDYHKFWRGRAIELGADPSDDEFLWVTVKE
jgi:hypothetical protein